MPQGGIIGSDPDKRYFVGKPVNPQSSPCRSARHKILFCRDDLFGYFPYSLSLLFGGEINYNLAYIRKHILTWTMVLMC
jgi:hypothetical protein